MSFNVGRQLPLLDSLGTTGTFFIFLLDLKKILAEVEDQMCEALTRIKQVWVAQRST